MNALKALRATGTVVIADTAEFSEIAHFKPSEGTTNPSLLYQAAQLPRYADILKETVSYAHGLDACLSDSQRLDRAVEYLSVQFGVQIYNLTGGISTEADVTYSFSVSDTVEAALRIIDLYREKGVPKEAVRIKISATWEGIQAGRTLERKYGISVLITIVFGLSQAIAAAEAGVTCIAPYVGRIGDWYKANGYAGKEDMGVERVGEMQDYLRKYGYKTKVMGASFRNTAQVTALAGLNYLTIAPGLLKKLEESSEEVEAKLTTETASARDIPKISFDENAFRWAFNSDACAVEKSADAMRRFADDTASLKALIAAQMKA